MNNDECYVNKDNKLLGKRLFLNSINSIGNKKILELLEKFPGGAEEIWACSDKYIDVCEILSDKQKWNFKDARRKWDLDKAEMTIYEKNISVITMEESSFPERLRNISDAPYLLYYYGKLPSEEMPTVSIIGSRMCSEYGRKMAKDFSCEMARKGVQIISGMASGIDGIAQNAAMDVDGTSYGILGCGVDICYPASNRKLYELLKNKGGIISEFNLGEKPLAQNFPRRNRIISGLSDIVLVIEAKERSGTAITVQMALEQGKEVFAVPGRNIDPLSNGCNRLIRDGAGIALEAQNILDCLKLMGYKLWMEQSELYLEYNESRKEKLEMSHNSLEWYIINLLQDSPRTVDELLYLISQNYETNIDIGDLNVRLAKLELGDIVVCHGGRWEIKAF